MALWETAVVLAVVAVVLVLFLKEALPVPVTAMLAAAILMVFPARSWDGAILTPQEGLAGFSSQATVAVMAMFVLSAGIQRSGAVMYVTHFLVRWAGKGPRRQALTLGAVAGPLSGVVNNTPVVAVLIPVASRLAKEGGHSPSKLLMPLSFFAMLGGTLTIIGTSTNLLGNDLLPRFGVEPFGFFSFTLVGVVGLVVAAIYFLTIGMQLMPDRGEGTAVERFDLKGFMAELEVPGDSEAVGKSLRDLGLIPHKGVQVVRVFREDRVLSSPRRTFMVRAHDVLMVQASRARLEALPEELGLTPVEKLHDLVDAEGPDGASVATAEIMVVPGSRWEGHTLQEIHFRDRYDALVLAIRHRDRVAIGPLTSTFLQSGDVLLVQGSPEALEALQESDTFVLTRARKDESFRKDKIAIATGILAVVVAVAAIGILPIVVTALAGAVAMVLTGCLKMQEFLDSIHWDIILLLAGIIPLGIALEKSGAAALAASGLVAVGGLLPPIAFLMLVFGVTSLFTEMISNNAAVVLLIPIVIAAALSLGLNPKPFALAVMLSASTSMLTPIGYQTNTMVYAPGRYRFTDYLRVGGPLNLLLIIILPWVIAFLFPL